LAGTVVDTHTVVDIMVVVDMEVGGTVVDVDVTIVYIIDPMVVVADPGSDAEDCDEPPPQPV
jgi:hypothetical protein